jgi:hypothetical protein
LDFGREDQKTKMATTVMKTGEKPAASAVVDPAEPHNSPKYYRGFVAGVFSGIAKLSGMSQTYEKARKS